ncbi:MAG: hypothetical protein OXF88_18760 [Rhodobacteraceae bacterium]|nr:hypothetical protein [Paracoccaceae bacterium]MCY4141435.1 hypothetical protein [Paracoccaceae bacterium]
MSRKGPDLAEQLIAARTTDSIRLLAIAEEIGLLDRAMTRPALRKILRELKESLPTKPSRSAKLARRLRDSSPAPLSRRDETRAKILMGGFLVAQTDHEPALRKQLVPGLAAYVGGQSGRAAATNWSLILPIYKAWGAGERAPEGKLRYKTETRVRIILGAYGIHVMTNDAAVRQTLLPELEPFLAASAPAVAARNRRVLTPYISRWSELDA